MRGWVVALAAIVGCSSGKNAPPVPVDLGPVLVRTEPVVERQVKLGEARFARRVLLEDRGLGWVNEIVRGGDKKPGVAWGVIGTQTAFFIDENGKPLTKALFDARPFPRYEHQAIDVEGDGLLEYTEANLTGLALRGHLGEGRWVHPMTGFGACSPGELDGNGKGQIVCAESDAIVLLDGAEQVRWRSPTTKNAPRARIGGTHQVIALEGSEVVLRDRQGKVVARKESALHAGAPDFALVHFPTSDSPERIALVRDGKLHLLALDGSEVGALALPEKINDPVSAVPVRMGEGGEVVHAVLGTVPNPTDRHVSLFIFDASGQLIFHEWIAGGGGALYAAPDGDHEKLLVGGGEGVVWEYTKP